MTGVAAMYEQLLAAVAAAGEGKERHLIAFSGGVDSSLVAHAVHRVFPVSSIACLGVSPSLSEELHRRAQAVAALIGIPLREIPTDEGAHPEYIANLGMSCFYCKASLYRVMQTLRTETSSGTALLFNGTNADDLADQTRVGLRAADDFGVISPISRWTKDEVRQLARHAGLPHWESAASPCLRSRLQIGVPATPTHLARIEQAERLISEACRIPASADFRVRHMLDGTAMIEAAQPFLSQIDLAWASSLLLPLGFQRVEKRLFRSGAVAAPGTPGTTPGTPGTDASS
jgi:pyridinium-3,5-biscarboxylic acid mononucleotide sulfurtransferase